MMVSEFAVGYYRGELVLTKYSSDLLLHHTVDSDTTRCSIKDKNRNEGRQDAIKKTPKLNHGEKYNDLFYPGQRGMYCIITRLKEN